MSSHNGDSTDSGARIAALEAALAATEARLRSTFVHNADGVLVVDERGEVRFANPAAARLFGRTGDALVDAPFGLPVVSDAAVEVEILSPDAERLVVELHSAPSEWDGQPVHVVTLRNVTDRHLLEEERRLLYDAVYESIDAIAITDAALAPPGPRIRFVNREFLRLTGYQLAEVINQPWSAFLAVPGADTWDRPLADAVASGRPVEQPAIARRKDGTAVPVDWRVAPARVESSAITHLVSFQRDASARLDAVEQLRESMEVRSAILDALPVRVALLDGTGHVLAANAAWERDAAREGGGVPNGRDYLAGCDAALGGMSPGLPPVSEAIRAVVEGRKARFEREQARHAGDGERWERVVAVPVARLRERAALVIHEDVTETKALERSVAEHGAQLRALFEQTSDAILIADNSGYYLDANPAACQLFGRQRAEIIGCHIRDLASTTVDVEASLVELLRLGAMSGTFEIERPDGTPRQAEFAARAHFVPGRHLWVLHDVTERQRLEGDLRQAQKMDAVGRLAGGVAHDFNNLLTAVLGYAEILREEVGHLQPAVTPLGAIITAASEAATLTRQLLAFSGRQMLRPRAIDLNATIRDLLPLLRSALGEDVVVASELDPTLPPVKADPGQLEEMVVAVAANARDAMPTGGRLRIETRTKAASGADPAAAELRFTDTGRGMPPETLEHLFEPFFSTKGLAHGGGLALASVYGFVRQSGGRIDVESAEGRGTTVVIQLPAAPRRNSPHETVAGAPPKGATILVVEDDDGVRELTRRVLVQVGHRVLAAASGAEALELVRTARIDLVLTDVVMPGMNGRELVERLRPIHPSARVIFSSGYTEDAILQRGVTSHDVAFLEKPYSPAQLRQAVQQALSQPPRT